MAHTELDLRERRVIEDMLNAKFSIRKIAAELGVSVFWLPPSQFSHALRLHG